MEYEDKPNLMHKHFMFAYGTNASRRKAKRTKLVEP